MREMQQQVEETARDAILVEDAALIRMMGMPVLEALPSRGAPYERTDPFILVHEGRFRLSEMSGKDTKHPHRGFDNLWYVLQGSASTGHTTGPGGSVERARLSEGSLLALRTGRGAWHAESVGADEVAEGLPTRREGDAIVRTLVDDDSRVRLGTPALILDIELPEGGQVTVPVPPEFQGFAYLLEGEGTFGANLRVAKPPQLVLMGPGERFGVTDAIPGTRFLLMAGQPYGETPLFNGPYVD
jgi:redox-sensitive bicupin YhaK (pirin superfamily)